MNKGKKVFAVITVVDKKEYKADLLGKGNILYIWEGDLMKRRSMCKEIVRRFLEGTYDKLHSYEFDRRPIYAGDKG